MRPNENPSCILVLLREFQLPDRFAGDAVLRRLKTQVLFIVHTDAYSCVFGAFLICPLNCVLWNQKSILQPF